MVAISEIKSQRVYCEQLAVLNKSYSLRATETELIANNALRHLIEKLKNFVRSFFLKKGELSQDQMVTLKITEFIQLGIEKNWVNLGDQEIKKLARYAGILEEPSLKSELRGMLYYSQLSHPLSPKIASNNNQIIINSSSAQKSQTSTITMYKDGSCSDEVRQWLEEWIKDKPAANYIVYLFSTARSPTKDIINSTAKKLFIDMSKYNPSLPFCALNLVSGNEESRLQETINVVNKTFSCRIYLLIFEGKVQEPKTIASQWEQFHQQAAAQKVKGNYTSEVRISS